MWRSHIYDVCTAAESNAAETKVSAEGQHVHTSAGHFFEHRSDVQSFIHMVHQRLVSSSGFDCSRF